MITSSHELTKCANCDSHYCMGCGGEDCPNCKLQEVAFYGIELENKLEAVKEFVLSRRADIENYMEDFGMLKPVLKYFLEEAEADMEEEEEEGPGGVRGLTFILDGGV